jgi:hypothetical protein
MEPYLFNLVTLFNHAINNPSLIDAASVMFALDLAGIMAILGFFANELAIEERNLVPKSFLVRYKRTKNIFLSYAGVFLLTTLPPFWQYQIGGTPIRFVLWIIPLVFFWVGRLICENPTQQQRRIFEAQHKMPRISEAWMLSQSAYACS